MGRFYGYNRVSSKEQHLDRGRKSIERFCNEHDYELVKIKENAQSILSQVKGLDDKSIICACKLSGYDVCYRAGRMRYQPVSEINPNKETIDNISIMVKRSMDFWKKYGPIVKNGFSYKKVK